VRTTQPQLRRAAGIRNAGTGRRLKMLQPEDALACGFHPAGVLEWMLTAKLA